VKPAIEVPLRLMIALMSAIVTEWGMR